MARFERDSRAAARDRASRWPPALLAVLLAGCAVVPCVFTTRLQAVFVVPKLAVLWGALALCLGIVGYGALRRATAAVPVRVIPIVDGAVMAFAGLTLLAWAFSGDREQSLYGERLQHQGLLTTLLYVGFFFVARLALTDVEALRLLRGAVTIGATFVAGYALVQKAGLDPVWDGYLPGGRVFSSIGQANALGAYLALALPIAVSLIFDRQRRVRALSIAATAAIGVALVFTQSRGAYLGVLAALVVLVVGWRRDLRLRMRHAAYAAVVLVALAVAAAGSGELDRVTSHADASARFHRDAWRVAVEIVKDNPVLGTGPETFPDHFPRYSHEVLPADRAQALDAFRVESPHNVYLAIAAGSGVPALAAYLTAIAGSIVVLVRALRSAGRELRIALVAVLAASAGHLVTDAFMTAEVTSTWLFWVLLGGALAVVATADRGPPRRGLDRFAGSVEAPLLGVPRDARGARDRALQ